MRDGDRGRGAVEAGPACVLRTGMVVSCGVHFSSSPIGQPSLASWPQAQV
jgi:hypothetical protein